MDTMEEKLAKAQKRIEELNMQLQRESDLSS